MERFIVSAPIRFGLERIPSGVHVDLMYDKDVIEGGYSLLCVKENMFRISSSSEDGILYGLLDLSDMLKRGEHPEAGKSVVKKPYIKNRGIKFNIPLDARTPSYSDASDSAMLNIVNMWDFGFWKEFLDRMAENKFNLLSLWSLSPFPSLVKIPEYPEVALDDVYAPFEPKAAQTEAYGMYCPGKKLRLVKKITIDEKISFWRSVMDYAASRCIKIMLFTWNVFTYGTEAHDGGFSDDLNNAETRNYYRSAVRALIKTYPRLAGIGVTAGENMYQTDEDIDFIADTYGIGIKEALKDEPERDFKFIHRMQMARYGKIVEAFSDMPCSLEISFKYSQAHMYSTERPHFIDGFLKSKQKGIPVWLTVRNDDFYMMRWGSYGFMKAYFSNMPKDDLEGIYIGTDGFTLGRNYVDRNDSKHVLFVDKMWYQLSLWGKLSYDIDAPEERFVAEIEERFSTDSECARKVFEAWDLASTLITRQQCVHWHDFDFQWYPEGCCLYLQQFHELRFADINEFVRGESIPNDRYLSVRRYAKCWKSDKLSPEAVAAYMIDSASKVLLMLEDVRNGNSEMVATVEDIRAMSFLGLYYAYKILAAIDLYRIRYRGETARRQRAISLMEKSAEWWKKYSASISSRYVPQFLTRLCSEVDVRKFDALVDEDIRIIENEK